MRTGRQWVNSAVLFFTLSLSGIHVSRSREAASLDSRYRRRTVRRLPFVVIPTATENKEQSSWFKERQLQINGTDDSFRPCPLCSGGFPVRANVVPPYDPNPPDLPAGLTCLDWLEIVAGVPEIYNDESGCQYLQSWFAGPCCDTPPSHVCEQNIRSRILTDYDSAVAPLDSNGLLELGVVLDFYHISDLDLKSATAEIFVWLHLNWTDPRLAWDDANVTQEDGLCLASVAARASLNAEVTELWVPDFDLYNQASGVQAMPESMATVYKDGTVTWIRNGGLRALCFFTGLRAFPYDTLGCSFLMGEWTRQQDIRVILGGENGDGFLLGDTAQDIKYTEYRLIPGRTETGYYPGASHLVYYNFYFERAERYYLTKIVIPTIVFTVLSFGVFLLDPRVGERLTYGLTVMLVIIAQDIVTAQRLPVANERLWINVFSNASFYWVLVALLESIFVMWLYFLNDAENNELAQTKDESEHVTDEGVVAEERQSEEWENSNSAPDASFLNNGTDNTEAEHKKPRKIRLFKTLRQKLMTDKPRDPEKYRMIQKFDRTCFLVVPTTYIIFVIVMLSTKSLWNNETLETYEDMDG